MKPKTPIQKEVIRLSATLPELTNAQRTYAFHHCFKHYGRRTAKGVITCTECGHAWKSGHSLADTLCGCTCPNCGTALEITDTRKRVFVDNEYFSIITTCKGYQVIRFFFVRSRQKVGQKAEYSIFEVAQRWIAPDGKSETVARLRKSFPNLSKRYTRSHHNEMSVMAYLFRMAILYEFQHLSSTCGRERK